MNETIRASAESINNNLIQFLREIIAIPSPDGKEGAVIGRLKREMIKTGYDEVWVDPFGNLFGRIGNGKRILAIDGHCDTVGIGNPDNWEKDPFSGDYLDGYIYGRGASDQKGGLASAIYAGKIIKEFGVPDDMTLLVVASVLEEDYEGLCWQYIVKEDKIRPDAVLLTEPTELCIRTGQRGRLEVKVKTEGVSSHGSAPERGENAIYKMSPVILDVERLNERLKYDPVFGKGTITISEIKSTAPSLCAVADSATIHLDRRLIGGDTMESALDEIRNLPYVKQMSAHITVPEYTVKSYTGKECPVKAYCPMWRLEDTHPLVQSAVKSYKTQFKSEPATGTWVFSTNGVSTMGMFNIPTIGFGPGEEVYAHAPNERIKAADLTKAVEFYAAFALNWGK